MKWIKRWGLMLIVSLAATQLLATDDLEALAESSPGQAAESQAGAGASDPLSALAAENELGPVDTGPGKAMTVHFGGYLKTLAYWNEEKYSDDLWLRYQTLSTRPPAQELSGYNHVGTRFQLQVEGYLGRQARMYTALNVDYNNAASLHDRAVTADDSTHQNADIRVVEGYIELYQESRTWKIGSQIVTWGFMEGMEVPTDRVNARDHSYKSTEYEDSKLPSTGVMMTQNLGGHRFELMYIPVPRTNVSTEFLDYFYPDSEVLPERKPNNGKWATRFVGTVGDLDYAVSYVEGLDPVADLTPSMSGRAYNRVRSPGLDLQYNLGSVLAKLSWVGYQTEDEDLDSPLIKNDWNKTVAGAEFKALDATFNLYLGQTQILDYPDDPVSAQTSFLLGQISERIDFVSGHVNAGFLTGDALNLILMAANYWDKDGETLQSNLRGTVTYKLTDGLEVLGGVSRMEMMENRFADLQLEVKYSF